MSLFDSLLSAPLFAQSQPGGWADTIDKAARTPQSVVVEAVAVFTIIRVVLHFITKDTPVHKRFAFYKFVQFANEALDALVYAGIFVFLIIRPYFVQAFRIPSGSMVSTLLVNDFIVANKLIYRYTDPQHGDVVVFRPPVAAKTDDSQVDPDGQMNVDFIKRCIGVPGDVVEVRNDVLYRNGQAVEEPYKHFTQPLNPEQTLFREETKEEHETDQRFDFKLVKYKDKYWPVVITGNTANFDVTHTAKDYFAKDDEIEKALMTSPPVAIPPGYYLMMGDNRNGSYDGRAWGLVPRDEIVGRAEWIWWPASRFGKIARGN